MTRCQYCNHEFHNALLRTTCPRCGADLKRGEPSKTDDNLDGFALGMLTGSPLSSTHGVSVGAMLGGSLTDSTPSCDSGGSSFSDSGGSGGDGGGGGGGD